TTTTSALRSTPRTRLGLVPSWNASRRARCSLSVRFNRSSFSMTWYLLRVGAAWFDRHQPGVSRATRMPSSLHGCLDQRVVRSSAADCDGGARNVQTCRRRGGGVHAMGEARRRVLHHHQQPCRLPLQGG